MKQALQGRSDLGRERNEQKRSRFTNRVARTLLPIVLLASAPILHAAISCPAVFTDHMVLQRDVPVSIWGTADPQEEVTAKFAGQSVSTIADESGEWSLKLAPMEASFDSRTLRLTGENEILFEDVLVGEVWLLSGQSNMDKPLGEKRGQAPTLGYPEVLAEADLPHLRLYRVPNNVKIKDKTLESNWIPCSGETVDAMQFSAAGFHFGKKLLKELDVPIGLIHSAFGGTMIEAWMPKSAFLSNPQLRPLLSNPYFSWVDGVQATELYESMIAPLIPYSLRGFLWYQGETNLMHGDSDIYATKLKSLIQAWRDRWSSSDAPFYFAQLAPFTYSEWIGDKSLTLDALPRFWEIQRSVVEPDQNIEIIPTIDLAQNTRDIHPINKRDVGYRFAALALAKTYRLKDRKFEIPGLRTVEKRTEGEMTLRVSSSLAPKGLIPSGQLGSFEIAGDDLIYRPAEFRLSDNTVILSSPMVKHPSHIRYGWDEKSKVPFLGFSNLPLYPFRTDSSYLKTLEPPYYQPTQIWLDSSSPPPATSWNRWNFTGVQDPKLEIDKSIFQLEAPELNNTKQTNAALIIGGLGQGPHSIVTQLKDGSTSYAEFHAEFGKDQSIDLSSTIEDIQSIEIDVPDPQNQAHSPQPHDGTTVQLDADESLTLSWEAPNNKVRFHLYMNSFAHGVNGTSKVLQAGRSSSTFVNTLSKPTHTIHSGDLKMPCSVVWRIDTIGKQGDLSRGKIWTFDISANSFNDSLEQ